MHAFLISTTNEEKALEKISEILKSFKVNLSPQDLPKNLDILFIKPKNTITIGKIRELKGILSRKPVNLPIQAAIILQSEKMTLPAQNAFLKILEEPGRKTALFLLTKNPEALLPTIQSRCQEIKLRDKKIVLDAESAQQIAKLLGKLKKARPGQRLALIEPFEKSREEAIKFCQNTIYTIEKELEGSTNPQSIAQTIKATQRALIDLENNINIKLVLDNWVLTL